MTTAVIAGPDCSCEPGASSESPVRVAWAVLHCSPKHSQQGMGTEVKQKGLKPKFIWDIDTANGGLPHYTIVAVPIHYFELARIFFHVCVCFFFFNESVSHLFLFCVYIRCFWKAGVQFSHLRGS